MTREEALAIAERIVERLFINGGGSKAERLLLICNGRDGGGWCREAARDQIVKVLMAKARP